MPFRRNDRYAYLVPIYRHSSVRRLPYERLWNSLPRGGIFGNSAQKMSLDAAVPLISQISDRFGEIAVHMSGMEERQQVAEIGRAPTPRNGARATANLSIAAFI